MFGPPDLLLTDGGSEFAGAVEILNELFAVVHETVPDQAKWRLGHAERNGGILKLMLMSHSLVGLGDMWAATFSVCGAKSRFTTHWASRPCRLSPAATLCCRTRS